MKVFRACARELFSLKTVESAVCGIIAPAVVFGMGIIDEYTAVALPMFFVGGHLLARIEARLHPPQTVTSQLPTPNP
jgi:hypothetical protein